jgi:hypothetical protein
MNAGEWLVVIVCFFLVADMTEEFFNHRARDKRIYDDTAKDVNFNKDK